MRISLLATLAVALFGVSYAAAREPRAADPISMMEDDLGQATAELRGEAGGGAAKKSGCDSRCATACGCSHGPSCIWTAGVEATFLHPDFDDARADVISDNTTQFDFEFEAAPRVWLGVENCCGVGLRARYWEFDAEAQFDTQLVDTIARSAVGTTSGSVLETYTVDLEGTKRVQRGCWDLLGSFGVRHASVSYDYQGTFLNVANGLDSDSSTVSLSRQFEGLGITGAVEGRRPTCDGHLALVWNLRGSVLWGDNKAAKREIDVDADIDGSVDVDIDTQTSRDSDTLFVGELQAGVEWSRPVKCLSADVFARALFEAQWWGLDNGNSLTGKDALAQGDLALYGVAFSFGITR